MSEQAQERRAKALKLLEAITEDCEVMTDGDHVWRRCRACLARFELDDKPNRELLRELLADRSALVALLEQYGRHTSDCEVVIGHFGAPKDNPNRHGWVWWKSLIDGQIHEKPRHVCGLTGFGAPGDTCVGCDTKSVSRPPVCTCGFGAALASLKTPQE